LVENCEFHLRFYGVDGAFVRSLNVIYYFREVVLAETCVEAALLHPCSQGTHVPMKETREDRTQVEE
jgi:hypothetical protein